MRSNIHLVDAKDPTTWRYTRGKLDGGEAFKFKLANVRAEPEGTGGAGAGKVKGKRKKPRGRGGRK